MHPLSLDHVTLVSVDPPELLRIAAACGCTAAIIRIYGGAIALPYDYLGNPAMRRETKQRAKDLGITIGVTESYSIFDDTPIDVFDRAFEATAELGVKYVNIHGEITDRKRQADMFSAFCERAGKLGIGVTLEWYKRSKVNTLDYAMEIINANPGMMLMVDALHVVRTATPLEALRALPADKIGWIQLCDGPLTATPEYMETEGRYNRKVPGEGTFPLVDIVKALPGNAPIGVEVPNKAGIEAGIKPEDWAKKVLGSTRRILEEAGIKLQSR